MAAAKTTTFDPFSFFSTDGLKEGYDKFSEGVASIHEFNKGAVDAIVSATGAYTKGVEKLASENTAFAQDTFQRFVSTGKSFASAGSPQEAFDVQSSFARETVSKNIDQISKVSDLVIDTATETAAPLTERYSELVEKIQAFRP